MSIQILQIHFVLQFNLPSVSKKEGTFCIYPPMAYYSRPWSPFYSLSNSSLIISTRDMCFHIQSVCDFFWAHFPILSPIPLIGPRLQTEGTYRFTLVRASVHPCVRHRLYLFFMNFVLMFLVGSFFLIIRQSFGDVCLVKKTFRKEYKIGVSLVQLLSTSVLCGAK